MRAATAFALGAALILVFDPVALRIAGFALMLVGIALAVFAIASEEFLAGDRGEDQA